jgi:tetratricopeptide (TPR) repeat protein
MWTSAGQQWKIPSMEVAKSDTRPLNQDPNVFRFENLADKKDRWQNWERQARQALTAGNAASLLGTCQKWAEEDYNNPQAHKCYGLALQANGSHARALTALRKAQSLDRLDTSIDQAIARSQLAQHRQ